MLLHYTESLIKRIENVSLTHTEEVGFKSWAKFKFSCRYPLFLPIPTQSILKHTSEHRGNQSD